MCDQLELPFSAQDYVHRIGRTGRAGHSGLAISLYNDADQRLLTAIEDLLDTRLPQQWYPGFEPDLTREVAPARRRGSINSARQLALGKAGGRKNADLLWPIASCVGPMLSLHPDLSLSTGRTPTPIYSLNPSMLS
ncbi:hypothetical protein PCI56_00675 [Plesiomonas shigelloides subsp. oncorhynchi]|nr:hypothetical protein [Plesiomonas shigelloides]